MINANEITGSGFTLIVSDPLFEERPQETINGMFQELQSVLNSHGFDISIVANQEDAMRFQGRLLFDHMFKKLDKLTKEDVSIE